MAKEGSVQQFYDLIKDYVPDNEIKVILDLGSRDLVQSIDLSKIYKNAKIYAFECNPQSYQLCLSLSKNFQNINVICKAVHKVDGKCNFYPIDTERSKNVGASSLFVSSGKYDRIEELPQIKMRVSCTRLDTWSKKNNINKIDMIWMDLQGAELLALHGLGGILKSVKVIHTEVIYQGIYNGQVLFEELNDFLLKNGFGLIKNDTVCNKWWGNAVYINRIINPNVRH